MRVFATFAVGGLSALLLGCGGSTFVAGDGGPGGGDGGPPSDSGTVGDGASGAMCPATAPSTGTACPATGLECEYGTNVDPACDTLVQCAMGVWTSPPGHCPVGMCPDAFGSMADCTSQGLLCAYPQGTCACGFGFGPPMLRDSSGPFWSCIGASAGCPTKRPDIGAACSMDGQTCDYAACAGGVALQCTGGIWKRAFFPCPQ
jgi:hypothetical protein